MSLSEPVMEHRNGPESSRLLETVLHADFHQKEAGGDLEAQVKNNGDICHAGGDAPVSLEMEKTTSSPHSRHSPTHMGASISDSQTIVCNHIDCESAPEEQDNDDDLVFAHNCCTHTVEKAHTVLCTTFQKLKYLIVWGLKITLLLGYVVYLGFALAHKFGDEGSVTLLVLTLLGVFIWCVKTVLSRTQYVNLKKFLKQCRGRGVKKLHFWSKWVLRGVAVVFIVVFLVVDVWTENPENIQSLLGILCFTLLLFCFSYNPAKINWHTVFWAMVLQLLLGFIILRTPAGHKLFDWVGRTVKAFLDFGLEGAKFLFGKENYKAHKVAVITVCIMVYFNSFIAGLFHLGVVQSIINSFGRFLGYCLDTGPIESFAASANVFFSLTETPMVLRPYLSKLTKAELHAVMTCGFASISGAVLGTYVHYGIPANHLLAASVMSAPAALAVSRLLCPETKRSKLSKMDCYDIGEMKHRNIWEAAARGAGHAGGLAMAALTSQIAFVSLLALTNAVLRWFGDRVGIEDVTFKWVCSYVFYPLVYAMGTKAADCRTVGALLGIKLFGTPIMAYTELADLRKNRLDLMNYTSNHLSNATWTWEGEDIILSLTNSTLHGGVIDERSEVIAMYMLCGFSTITSIGVCLGVLLNLAEDRKDDITGMVVNTLVAGNFASFLTASIAGLMFGKSLPM